MENKNVPKIKVTKNGPYLIPDGIPISEQTIITDAEGTPVDWRRGTEYPPRTCALCRCGQSKTKPFCDGTHSKVGFDGTETASPEEYIDNPKHINGPALELTDIEELCASARFCHRAGGIWNLVPKSDDPEAKRIAVEEACDCPSGRLVVKDKEANKIIEASLEKSIGLIEDPAMGVSGPIWVRGGIPVESADGKTYRVRNRVTLCRCGKSANKPFCDSSHYPEAEEVEQVHKE
ncbi:MAG: CDGSH iron-sulfur domain-containing protein [Candidatus Bathyarchaeota archaeon]|nr:CDGSH iron-sulfur domain-containing protein [Candidatus Bathyarchaeota archaeon]